MASSTGPPSAPPRSATRCSATSSLARAKFAGNRAALVEGLLCLGVRDLWPELIAAFQFDVTQVGALMRRVTGRDVLEGTEQRYYIVHTAAADYEQALLALDELFGAPLFRRVDVDVITQQICYLYSPVYAVGDTTVRIQSVRFAPGVLNVDIRVVVQLRGSLRDEARKS